MVVNSDHDIHLNAPTGSIWLDSLCLSVANQIELRKEGGSSTMFTFDTTTQDEQNLILRDQEGKEIDFNFGRDVIYSDLDLIVSKIGRSSSYMCNLPSKSGTLVTSNNISLNKSSSNITYLGGIKTKSLTFSSTSNMQLATAYHTSGRVKLTNNKDIELLPQPGEIWINTSNQNTILLIPLSRTTTGGGATLPGYVECYIMTSYNSGINWSASNWYVIGSNYQSVVTNVSLSIN